MSGACPVSGGTHADEILGNRSRRRQLEITDNYCTMTSTMPDFCLIYKFLLPWVLLTGD